MKYKLGEIFSLQMGKTPDRHSPEFWSEGTESWISIADLSKCNKYIENTAEKITMAAIEESGIKPIPRNTVIMSFKLSIGKVAITPKEMYSNEAIMAFIDKGVFQIEPAYLYYLLMHRDWDVGTNKAVMGKTLNKATLSQISINIHELSEQHEITKVLDAISSIIEARKQQLQKLDELVKARFVEFFGDMVYNQNGWKMVNLGSVCDVRDGTHDSPKYFSEGYPLVTSKNVTSGRIDFAGCSLICKEDYDKINERSRVDFGDILMPMIGTVGKPVIVDVDVDFAIKNVALIKFYENSMVINFFVRALLQSDYFDHAVISKIRGGTQKFIALSDIRKLEIYLPPMDIQKKFAAFVEQTDKMKAAVQKALDEAQLLFDSLMQKYFN